MPSKQSPGKNNYPFTDDSTRLRMLSLSDFSKNSNCIISDYELKSNKIPSYTIDAIKYLKDQFNNSKIYIALGLDQFNDLHKWYKSSELVELVEIICFNRMKNFINNKLSIKYEFIEDFDYNISSSEIRSLIKNNNDKAKDMVNKNIFNYIMKCKLYR